MNLKKNHYSRRALALLLTLVMCVGMIPTAFAAQQNSYHDPAEHWMQASGRTNELDANSVVTRETFKCGECGKATSFEVFRVPEYTRNGQPALSRNVKYSDGTMVDGVGKGDTMDGIPCKDWASYIGPASLYRISLHQSRLRNLRRHQHKYEQKRVRLSEKCLLAV